MKISNAIVGTALLTLLGLSGCAVETTNDLDPAGTAPGETPDSEIASAQTLFAEFESEDFGTVRFFEPEEGEILVNALTPDGAPGAALLKEVSPIELYEMLAGEPLPERFAALAEVGAAEAAEEDDASESPLSQDSESGLPEVNDGPGTSASLVKESMTTEKYIDTYCVDHDGWCWTNITGTSYIQRRTQGFMTWAHSYRGQVTHQLKRKNTWGNWKVLYSVVVPQGYTSYTVNLTFVKFTTESRVYNATGDGYHHSGVL